jgi:hypothetical protein
MNEVLLTNIFFIITGSAILFCTVVLCIALFYVITVVRTIKRIVDTIEAGAEVIVEDMQHMRTFFSQNGFVARLVQLLAGKKSTGARARKKATDDD